MSKSNPNLPPRPPKGAEVIFKQNCECVVEDFVEFRSGIFLLANKPGLRWLSDYFAWMASRVNEKAPFFKEDPDDHQHLDREPPINKQLSDPFGVIIGSCRRKHRKRTLKACGISVKRRQPGHPVAHFRHQLEQMMSMMGWGDAKTRSQTVRELKLLIRQANSSLTRLSSSNRGPKARESSLPPP